MTEPPVAVVFDGGPAGDLTDDARRATLPHMESRCRFGCTAEAARGPAFVSRHRRAAAAGDPDAWPPCPAAAAARAAYMRGYMRRRRDREAAARQADRIARLVARACRGCGATFRCHPASRKRWCGRRECQNARKAAARRARRAANRKAHRAADRARYAEHRERVLEARRRFYAEHRDRILARRRFLREIKALG